MGVGGSTLETGGGGHVPPQRFLEASELFLIFIIRVPKFILCPIVAPPVFNANSHL